MRKLFLALGFALSLLCGGAQAQLSQVGPANAILCNQMANLTAGPTTITQIAAAVTGKIIVICGWHITNTASSGTFQITYGTGSNCGTGNVSITPVLNVSNTAPSTDHIDYGIASTPISQALCITPSVATIAGIVYFAQY